MAGPGEVFPEIEQVERHVPYRVLVNQERRVINDVFPLAVRVTENASPFSEMMTVERTPVLAHVSTDPLSILRDYTETTNNGSVTSTTAEFFLDAPASGDSAILETAERGRYVPGFASEAGMGIRLDSRSAGSTLRWGLFDSDDGYEYIYDDDGFAVRARSDSAEQFRTPLDQFSVDRLDGDGPSGIDLAESGGIEGFLAEGHIWEIRFTWYGYGTIEYLLVHQRDNPPVGRSDVGPQRVWVLHRQVVNGSTSVQEPNLPVSIEASDGASVFVGGRQCCVLGPLDIQQRNAGAYRLQQSLTADGTFKPLIAIRRRTDAEWPREVKITTDEIGAITNQDLVLQTFIGSTVDDGAWVTVPDTNGESAVEVNLTATSFTKGTDSIALDPTLASAGGGNKDASTVSAGRRTSLPRLRQAVLAARVIGGQNATVSSAFDWLEIR